MKPWWIEARRCGRRSREQRRRGPECGSQARSVAVVREDKLPSPGIPLGWFPVDATPTSMILPRTIRHLNEV